MIRRRRPKKRRYDSTLRREQAAGTRRRILEAAGRLFAAHGYAGTSMAAIASEAAVSVETVKANGPKRDLLVHAFELLFAGSESYETIHDQDEIRAVLALPDHIFLEGAVAHLVVANGRALALWRALQSAANSDPAIARSLDGIQARRLADCRQTMDVLAERRMLAKDADLDRLAAVFAYLVAPEGYELLVAVAGWSRERYAAWLQESLEKLVLAAQ